MDIAVSTSIDPDLPPKQTMAAGVKDKILCVEDNEDECDLVKEILCDYEVVCVPTVARGCALLDDTEFVLVIIDEHLPDGSGLALCAQISRANSETPVIIVSGDIYITAAEAVAAGAKAFLAKSKATYVDELRHLANAYAAAGS
jgi:DNA-binding NtrC family response regulator